MLCFEIAQFKNALNMGTNGQSVERSAFFRRERIVQPPLFRCEGETSVKDIDFIIAQNLESFAVSHRGHSVNRLF